MLGIALDNNGDAIITAGKLKMTSGTDFIAQTVRQVLRTNLGEWWLNKEEGIDFSCILCKKPNYEQIEDNVRRGLMQVDETLELTSFECNLDKNRMLIITFTAKNSKNETIEVTLRGD